MTLFHDNNESLLGVMSFLKKSFELFKLSRIKCRSVPPLPSPAKHVVRQNQIT